MNTQELLLKTAFCCMACDGDIDKEEISLLKKHKTESNLFVGLSVEEKLNEYVEAINKQGKMFLASLLSEIVSMNLSASEELQIVKLAIEMIEADKLIEYSEIAFFKRIRAKLKISDEEILSELPDKEDYLLPDIIDDEIDTDISFNNISISKYNIQVNDSNNNVG